MTAIYMDSFDHYGPGQQGANNMLNGAWAEIQGNIFGTPGPTVPPWGSRTGPYALGSNRDTNVFGNYRLVLPSTEADLFISFGFGVPALPSGNFQNQLIALNDSSNNQICALWVQSTGSIVLVDNNGNTIGSTQGPVIVANNWHFIEFNFNQSAQTFTLRVDDASATNTPVIAVTGLSLTAPCAQIIALAIPVSSADPTSVQSWMDDLFIRNSAGSVNNSWLGDRQIATQFPDADTPTSGWTPNYYMQLGAGILSVSGGAAWANSTSFQQLGSGDFTIEGFIRFQSLPTGSNKAVIFGKFDETNNLRSYELFLGSQALNGSSLCWQTSTDGTNSTVEQSIVYPFVPDLDTWYNIAIVRASGELLLFVDGIQLGLPIADSRTYFTSSTPFSMGGQVETTGLLANTSIFGWMDEVRLTAGVGRYTANYTPTTVEYPRNSSDPDWNDVAILCGFDSLIQDESMHSTPMSSSNASQQLVLDGPLIGVFSTVDKPIPDDNTFVSAPFIAATSILTMTAQPSAGNTVTVGTKNGSTAAVYTFETALTAAFQVLIDTSLQQTLQNLFNAINAGPGAGTKYGTGTTSNFNVIASQLPTGQMQVIALLPGTGGNSIATSSSGITGSWDGSTLSGGLNIPGPTNFSIQRLPLDTTIVSAIQINTRAFKSDSGVGTMNTALVGALGGTTAGPTHALTLTPVYYGDIYETDPDTSGPISPTTLTNGAIQINRDT